MQFLMALALRMGRTLGELRQTMTVGEFRMWAEYDRISPIGDIRGDIPYAGDCAAQHAHTIFQQARG